MESEWFPDTYQIPVYYTDIVMAFLTPKEWKILSYLIWLTYGPEKIQDGVSISQINNDKTGMSLQDIKNALRGLVLYGLVMEIENSKTCRCNEKHYLLTHDTHHVDLRGLKLRKKGVTR